MIKYINMVITHLGGQCFKVTFGDLTLAFDPISKNGTLPGVKFGADIALISRNHPDMNGVAEVTYGERAPFVVSGPGEYERSGVTIQGFLTKSAYGLAKGETAKTGKAGSPDATASREAVNTMYAVDLEDMNLVFLGALSDPKLPVDAREAIDEIDILFVPVGDDGVLSPSAAHELAVSLEPHIIIPMHWSGMGQPKALEAFLKEEGGKGETVDKLTIKKKDALTKDGAIIVIKP